MASFEGVFALPDPASRTALEELWRPLWAYINETYPMQTVTRAESILFPDLYSAFLRYADNSLAGVDKVVGSWLLPAAALTDDAMLGALKEFVGDSGARLYMVSGKGVWEAQPRGGENAVNPAWREALVHAGKSDRRSSRCQF